MDNATLTDACDAQLHPGDEYERQPVPAHALLNFRSFVGMYAGEHCAATELMIGPLFVASGVSAFDVVAGLLLGNALAVLSWMLFCAPIATRTRLTLYFQLEKICGRRLVTLYNLANGVMFCFLTGAHLTVAATVLGVYFPNLMPDLTDVFSTNSGWIVSVLVLGATISIVAAFGYEIVARVANIAAPWMTLIFLAFGLITLRRFVDVTNAPMHSLGDLWTLADTVIWKGGEPFPGQVKFTFWHVLFFAWFCNLAVHIGMSDLSIFRFAKKSWYSVSSATGMYVGHFMAWLAASMLFAFFLHESRPDGYMIDLLANNNSGYTRAQLEQSSLTPELIRQAMQIEDQQFKAGAIDQKRITSPTPLPGPLAYGACGLTGLICVIIAGWTTANPTIYRAGLAFQAIVPRSSRFKVTLMTGGLCTLIAAFLPVVAMRLLDFVALYGLLLMPMGAVIFVDFWLLAKLGLQNNYAERNKLTVNWAAGLTWIITLAICWFLVWRYGNDKLFFVSLPGWFIAVILYIVLSRLLQKKPTN